MPEKDIKPTRNTMHIMMSTIRNKHILLYYQDGLTGLKHVGRAAYEEIVKRENLSFVFLSLTAKDASFVAVLNATTVYKLLKSL